MSQNQYKNHKFAYAPKFGVDLYEAKENHAGQIIALIALVLILGLALAGIVVGIL